MLTLNAVLPYHQPKASPELEVSWARLGLAAANNRNAVELAQDLRDLLVQLQLADYSPEDAIEHPAAVLLIAQLAELAGLHFHYPSRQLWQCQNTPEPALPSLPAA